jgi:hypothetical protein
MTKRLKSEQAIFEVISQEDPQTGDILLPLPPELLGALDWKEGDTLDFKRDDQGRWVITKLVE